MSGVSTLREFKRDLMVSKTNVALIEKAEGVNVTFSKRIQDGTSLLVVLHLLICNLQGM